MARYRIPLLFVCLCLALEAGANGGRPIKFSEPVQSVDTVRFDNGTITLRYPFENISGKTVTILEVRSSCGCFTGKVGTKVLKPGSKAVLTAVLDPHTIYGDLDRHLTVVCSDGTNTILSSLTVKGYVLRDESEGEIRFACDLGRGLRTDSRVNSLRKDRFGDFVFSVPLYNNTDEPMLLDINAPWRFKLYAPESIPARTRIDLRGEYRDIFLKNGSRVSEMLKIKVNGENVIPLHVKGTIY